MIERNYAFELKSSCWYWFVDLKNDRFVDNMADTENFGSIDIFDLRTLFGEIRSNEFVEKNKMVI